MRDPAERLVDGSISVLIANIRAGTTTPLNELERRLIAAMDRLEDAEVLTHSQPEVAAFAKIISEILEGER